MNEKIWLSSPHMGGAEQKYVNDAFATNWIAPLGPHVNGFEQDLANYTGAKHAAALSSGTAALHLALIMLGVEPGDEVICQSMTFSASANPILYLKATPVFVGSERDTWNMCPEMLREAIVDRLRLGKKPKAIIPVHLYGMPAKMHEIMAVANEFEIPVIEDAAEALGSTINGKAMGTFGLMGVLSFNGNKIITTSGGGALLADEESYITKSRFLATQARDEAPHYQHSELGYNYRMSNVCAAIGRGQMEVLPERIAKRRENFAFYQTALAAYKGFEFLPEPEGFISNRWLSTVLINEELLGVNRHEIAAALSKENIESRPLWKPMHLQPIFEQYPFYGAGVAQELFDRGLCLPSGSNLTDNDLNRVVGEIINLLEKVAVNN